MPIRVLEEKLINQIAAGEVVERPSSVVKELVENSLDAGATRVEVEIAGGGSTYLRVTDNGKGMTPEDIPLAFTRHATSKISRQEDLEAISTLGFRGEALPSIAAVARVELVSSAGGESGWRYRVEGGQVMDEGPCASPPGTQVVIRDLFYNVPARLKFMKSLVTEANHVHDMVFRLALAHPGVSFTYRQNGRPLFKTPGKGDIGSALEAIKGASYGEQFIPLQIEGDYRLWGLISAPEWKRRNRREENFFVNQRWVRSPLLLRAVDEAYRGRLVSGEYPGCYLNLALPPGEVDVNVHPQKLEVRFRNEDRVYSLVAGELKKLLENRNRSLWTVTPAPDQQENDNRIFTGPGRESEAYRDGQLSFSSVYPELAALVAEKDQPYERPAWLKNETGPLGQEFKVIGQVFASFILIETPTTLLLVDQHAADERIQFDKLQKSRELWEVQELLLPVTMTVSPRRLKEIEAIKDDLAALGFQLEILGEQTVVLRGAPLLARGQEEKILSWLLDELATGEVGVSREEVFHRAVATIACKKAVKANQPLDRFEMEAIISSLAALPDGGNCPHGRPTVISIDRQRMAEWFKR